MAEQKTGGDSAQERSLRQEAERTLSPEAKKSILKRLAGGAAALGGGAVKLMNALRGIQDPEEALRTFDAQLAANRSRREPVAAHHETLYAQIAAKKKIYMEAPAARTPLLEMELRALLAEYKSEERQLKIYLENETTINAVRGRTLELVAMGLRQIKESQIDGLTDRIEDAAAEAEDVSGALQDLEKAGARRESEGAHEAFLDELSGFEDVVAPAAPVADTASPAAPTAADPEPLDLSGF